VLYVPRRLAESDTTPLPVNFPQWHAWPAYGPRPADDLRLDLGETAETLQNRCYKQVRLAQASIAG
jgi:hypothetical protein